MRTTIYKLAKALGRLGDLPEPIYEFGAYREAVHTYRGNVRDSFPNKRWVGADVRSGPGVDEVQDLHRLALADNTIGTALLFDTLEHVRQPWQAMSELHRCLMPGGILVMTSHMYFPIHAYPEDYWRFTPSAFSTLLEGFDVIVVDICGLKKLPHTVVAIATKGAIDQRLEAAIRETYASWKRHGSRSWKEVMLAISPPCLLIPTYDAFMWLEMRLGRTPTEDRKLAKV